MIDDGNLSNFVFSTSSSSSHEAKETRQERSYRKPWKQQEGDKKQGIKGRRTKKEEIKQANT